MTNSGTKLVFFGNERLVSALPHTDAPILRMLIRNGYQIGAVVSHHTVEASRTKRPLEVAQIAQQHGIPVFTPAKPTEIAYELKKIQAQAAILVAYGRIIPQSIIDIFPSGIINIHPSLLPQYRGPTPIETAILNQDKTTGVSIMHLTAGMDEGPVYAQKAVTISQNDTKFDLYERLAAVSTNLLQSTLPHILDGSLTPLPQAGDPTYTKLLTKQAGTMQPQQHSAAELQAQVRAYLGYPKSRYQLFGHQIVVTKATVSATQDSPLDIICKNGAFLRITELIAPNGKRMTGSAFLNGYAA